MNRAVFLMAAGCLAVGCAGSPDREELKAELKREILAELGRGGGGDAAGAEEAPLATPPTPAATGAVRGRVVLRDQGLAGCRVRLVRLEAAGGLGGLVDTYRELGRFESVTGEEGEYRFAAVPPGAYRVQWRPEGETGWIRRLHAGPDVVVEVGETVEVGTFRAGRPVAEG